MHPVPSGPASTPALRAGTVTLATAALALAFSAPARADVLITPTGDDDARRSAPAATLVTPDGALRTLARIPEGRSDPLQGSVVSPDRRFVARASGVRIAVVPTDGTPARILGLAGLREAPERFVGSAFRTWWEADGTHVLRDGVRTGTGRPVVLRCAIATGACTTRAAPRGLARIGVRADGSTLWTTAPSAASERVLADGRLADGDWTRTSSGAVRDARAVLRRRFSDRLVRVGADGRTSRTLRRTTTSLAAGTDDLAAWVDHPELGTLVSRERSTVRLATRTRGGRLQARLSVRVADRGWARLTPSGRPAAFRPRSPDGDRLDSVLAPIGARGWVGKAVSRDDRKVPVTVAPDGTVRRILLDGALPTPRTLHAALGLPRTPPAGGAPSILDEGTGFRFADYEAATDSVIALWFDGGGDGNVLSVVGRLPLAGGSPTLARAPTPLGDEFLAVVSAW